MEKKKIQVWLPLLFSITMIAGIFIGYKMRDEIPGKSFFYTEKRRPVQEVMELIKNKYVDTVDLNMLADTAIQAILSKLDPHSVFIPAKDLDQVNEEIAGSFFGIGIEYNIFNDSLHVVNVLKEGPSFKAGILTGDRILKANNYIISGKKAPIDSIRSVLRGPRGSIADITLLRGNRQMNIKVTRDIIPISSVDAAYMADSITGYIRLNKFTQHTYREFMLSLESLKKQGLQKLIFDLRGNGGGVLDEAVEIADEFLEGDKLITYTIGRHSPRKEYRCRRTGQFEKGKLVILADEGTASASEIIIGALQDWDRATIVGRKTFGKGLVQDQFDLSDKSALRLTIARYYTPIGRSIQRSYANGGKAYYEEISNRFQIADSSKPDSPPVNNGKAYLTSSGKKVYSGGGISPDYFIPADTAFMNAELTKIFLKGLTNDFGYQFYMANRGISNEYKTPAQFANEFRITGPSWKFFASMAVKDSINLQGLNVKSRAYLERLLKASLARQLWHNDGYFQSSNHEDETLLKAMEIIRK